MQPAALPLSVGEPRSGTGGTRACRPLYPARVRPSSSSPVMKMHHRSQPCNDVSCTLMGWQLRARRWPNCKLSAASRISPNPPSSREACGSDEPLADRTQPSGHPRRPAAAHPCRPSAESTAPGSGAPAAMPQLSSSLSLPWRPGRRGAPRWSPPPQPGPTRWTQPVTWRASHGGESHARGLGLGHGHGKHEHGRRSYLCSDAGSVEPAAPGLHRRPRRCG